MCHQWNRQAPKSPLSAVSTLVFHLTVVFLLLTHCCEGQSQMVGPSKPILAMVGGDIMLPCHLVPATDVVAKTLEWARLDLNPRFVQVRRDGVELLINQNPLYIGRTSLSTDKLKHGDVSLKLSKVKLSDEGKYTCHIPGLGTSAVDLVVGSVSSLTLNLKRTENGVLLQCESAGWYPEPEVLWLDGEGNLLSAGPTETVRGPDDLYTVSSRVTVEKRHSNSFTCRVQQNNINQTRETEIGIQEDVFMDRCSSSSAVRIIVVFSVCLFFCISAAFFLLGKRRQNKGHNKKHPDDGAGENEQLVKRSMMIKDLDDEKLQDKKEEQKDLQHVISVLMEQKKELETSRDKRLSQLEMLEEELKKKEKKLKKVNDKYSWDKGDKKSELLEAKQELDKEETEHHNSLKNIEERLQKTEDMITILTERKKKVDKQIEQMIKQLEEAKRQREKEEVQLKHQSEQLEREQTNKSTDSLPLEEGHSSQPLES